ncbi:MAG TPA: alpha/beta hydrolase [Solirubrobacteraceae bacterium]|nr:alpha/beta hydrolase [Solirubrobacteraceae bacterium]
MSAAIEVPVAGGSLAIHRLGSVRDDAPAVLAVHGILATSAAWLAAGAALRDEIALIAPDLRGRGDSHALPGPFGLDAHVADLLAVLDALELERVVMAGHSMGAYVVARLAARHPERVSRLVLVDGGLTIDGRERVDPGPFLREFLGPALARLRMTFADVDEYVAWWCKHPSIAGTDIDEAVLRGYAEHDLVGTPPQARSSVNADALEPDGGDVLRSVDARGLTLPAVLLCAPRGMVNDPNPMQPLALARAWAASDPGRRRAVQVPDTNHYTIALGAAGAAAVAAEIRAAVAAE